MTECLRIHFCHLEPFRFEDMGIPHSLEAGLVFLIQVMVQEAIHFGIAHLNPWYLFTEELQVFFFFKRTLIVRAPLKLTLHPWIDPDWGLHRTGLNTRLPQARLENHLPLPKLPHHTHHQVSPIFLLYS